MNQLKDYHLNLNTLFNNQGSLAKKEPNHQNTSFSLVESYFPSEYLPNYGEILKWNDTSFLFPERNKNNFDNLVLDNQIIKAPSGNTKEIYILGASNNGSFYDKVELHLNKEIVYSFELALTDFIEKNTRFNDVTVLECPFVRNINHDLHQYTASLYCHKETLPSNIEFDEIKLGDNPFIHIFSITLRGDNYA
ncbi:hypothetical protein ORN01_21960 [Bacillus cereus]|uniref:hypothetical protein n=1 Tax=Bacillus cereus group TaxID=86661 RepID=UPI000279CDF0|nr:MULTISPECIES: hypothetical protein [Bacillus cereus group]EJR73593.1 hypothetical protein IK9_05128 [Bacillus cereus VD166]MDA1913602.1 hypothetical protein [Bacillus cereus]MDA2659722.1 hypothetical protein [Bacillus cereus]MDZ4631638.1 hypothetical protein [Bacillus cereus]PEV50772.1 hypothetical protein CN432_09215 [Bacillus thuringiensis]